MENTKNVTCFTRADFRKWLEKNHLKEKKVAVVLHKKHTGKKSPSHRELMEEAICFGWIDTTIKRLDEDTYLRHFARRNSKSKWSDNTLSYAKALKEKGLMSPEGLKFYEEGLSRPTHDHGIPKNPDMPLELKRALAKDKIARDNFEKFPPSAKRMFYRWFLSAKTSETRGKRVKLIVQRAREKRKDILV
mgnify:CR=1 FL=1